MVDELRQAIRSILLEELAAHGVGLPPQSTPEIRVEEVEINSDGDLAQFVRRLLQLTRNGGALSEIESGRHVFRLRTTSTMQRSIQPQPVESSRTPVGGTMTFDAGLITEKQVRNLPENISVVKVGGSVRLTPLASDAMRRAGIKIEKVTS